MTKAHVLAFVRGFAIVALTSMNVAQIAGGHYLGAFAGGVAISWVWFVNARGAAHGTEPHLRECYALGAGLGTVFGMLLIHALYG